MLQLWTSGCRSAPQHTMVNVNVGNGPYVKTAKLLDFNGLCNRKSIFQFNAEIPDCAVHFCVPK